MGEQMTIATKQQPSSQSRGLLITGLIIAMLFAALDGTIVGTAMPRIVGELGGLGVMTWLTTAYMLTSTTMVPIAGKLADLLGRKVVYITGLIIFMVGSVLCGFTDSMTQLIVYRGLQGIGGGIMMPMALIIIGDLFTGKERAKWQGVFGALYGLSSVIGPPVGGYIVDALNWRWVFYINLPIGIIATIFIAMGLKKHKVTGPIKIDFAGITTMIIGVVSMLLALTFGGKEYAWFSWQVIGLMTVSIVAIASFIRIEKKTEEPILPVNLFANKIFSSLNGVGFLMSVGMFGAIMFVPLFMQGVVGISPSESGAIMTPMMLTMILTSVVGSRMVYRWGVKKQILVGMIIMATGFGFLTSMGIDTTKLTATSFMMVIGLGMGLVMPIITLALQESFPKSQLGVVTSSSQFFRSIGGTFGVTILGSVMNAKSASLLTDYLLPLLHKLPSQAKGMVDQIAMEIHTNPQGLYSMLFSPEAMQKVPESVRDQLIPVLKHSMVDSLHVVFMVSFGIVLVGAILTLWLPHIPLGSARKVTQENSVNESPPVMEK
ncbi:DHA2 family efflux MFS transporter permease subunit [Brevibacillus laterosporus]|nr:MDR family MFS transporter [Brevibacillus laterosporus]TPG67864.1 DHA2 family efflux MFS transporter permease subunit [Brevibacillus laterosporus]TPG74438.1 DHA2 family efflux MFS transporter permease subunit [Brevibacillus laterosporus]